VPKYLNWHWQMNFLSILNILKYRFNCIYILAYVPCTTVIPIQNRYLPLCLKVHLEQLTALMTKFNLKGPKCWTYFEHCCEMLVQTVFQVHWRAYYSGTLINIFGGKGCLDTCKTKHPYIYIQSFAQLRIHLLIKYSNWAVNMEFV